VFTASQITIVSRTKRGLMYLTTSSNRYSFSNWVYDVTLRPTHATIIQRMASLYHIHAKFYTTLWANLMC
jgi:hypothetical protein